MANIRFDEVELSTLGFANLEMTARSMAEVRSERVLLPGRDSYADIGFGMDPGTTDFQGNLSADTEDFADWTHENWLLRLDAVKMQLNPHKGYRKLVISGDQPYRFRWARLRSLAPRETRPIYKAPVTPITLTFENLEAHWRETAPGVATSTTPTVVPNSGFKATRPRIRLVIGYDIRAYQGAVVEAVTLFRIDDFQANWKGTTDDGTLRPGDVLVIDSETLTVTRQTIGSGSAIDVVRYYDYGGPGAFGSDGFPLIDAGGSTISYIHPNVASIVVDYDVLYL